MVIVMLQINKFKITQVFISVDKNPINVLLYYIVLKVDSDTVCGLRLSVLIVCGGICKLSYTFSIIFIKTHLFGGLPKHNPIPQIIQYIWRAFYLVIII